MLKPTNRTAPFLPWHYSSRPIRQHCFSVMLKSTNQTALHLADGRTQHLVQWALSERTTILLQDYTPLLPWAGGSSLVEKAFLYRRDQSNTDHLADGTSEHLVQWELSGWPNTLPRAHSSLQWGRMDQALLTLWGVRTGQSKVGYFKPGVGILIIKMSLQWEFLYPYSRQGIQGLLSIYGRTRYQPTS